MKFNTPLSSSDAIRLINTLSLRRTPFLFVVDYAATAWHVAPLADIDATTCLFNIANLSNATPQTHTPSPTLSFSPPPYDSYRRQFDVVMRHLRRGDTFLTNLTTAVPITLNGTLVDIFHASRAPFRLLMDTPDGGQFVCFSPEPFVTITPDGRMSSFPMKGTARADNPDALRQLLDSPKEAAEHATIVDLIRNDLSQSCHDVHVSRYRYAEKIATCRGAIWQTSSAIVGTLPPDYPAHLGDILASMLPAGSITGAPKPMTQSVIAEAEDVPRGYYTGVMGVFDGLTLTSAVMIRFIVRHPDGRTFYHAGGGITARSDARAEYEEVLTKIYL